MNVDLVPCDSDGAVAATHERRSSGELSDEEGGSILRALNPDHATTRSGGRRSRRRRRPAGLLTRTRRVRVVTASHRRTLMSVATHAAANDLFSSSIWYRSSSALISGNPFRLFILAICLCLLGEWLRRCLPNNRGPSRLKARYKRGVTAPSVVVGVPVDSVTNTPSSMH